MHQTLLYVLRTAVDQRTIYISRTPSALRDLSDAIQAAAPDVVQRVRRTNGEQGIDFTEGGRIRFITAKELFRVRGMRAAHIFLDSHQMLEEEEIGTAVAIIADSFSVLPAGWEAQALAAAKG